MSPFTSMSPFAALHFRPQPLLGKDSAKALGISAIGTYEPPWVLPNEWFNGSLSRKFVPHTGILSRRISAVDEITMGVRAVENLQDRTGCDLRNCRAVVMACSSLLHKHVARRFLREDEAQRENFRGVAKELTARLGIESARVFGINWGCSGYSKAMQIATRCPQLHGEQFILVITVNRTSRITDFGCKATGPIFGDFAQATLLSGGDSRRHPMELAVVYAAAERQPANGVFFDFDRRENVTVPTPDGGQRVEPNRVVFSLDMMGLGDGAPRAMAFAAAKALAATAIRPQDVDLVVPHQAGTAVIRLTAMKLDELGVRCEVINGMTERVGNISSSSVPYSLLQNWNRLHGTILCPTAAVGKPGHASLTQGCIVLKSV